MSKEKRTALSEQDSEIRLEAMGYADWQEAQANKKNLDNLAAVLRGKTAEQIEQIFDAISSERGKAQVAI